ncbi:MAG: hypothetical protein ACKV1O_05555 [Saprospiraceae bacterium]
MTDKNEKNNQSSISQILIGVLVGFLVLAIEYGYFQNNESHNFIPQNEKFLEKILSWAIVIIWNITLIPAAIGTIGLFGIILIMTIISPMVLPVFQIIAWSQALYQKEEPVNIYGDIFKDIISVNISNELGDYLKVILPCSLIWLGIGLLIYLTSKLSFYPSQKAIDITDLYMNNIYTYIIENENIRKFPSDVIKFSIILIVEIIVSYPFTLLISKFSKKNT